MNDLESREDKRLVLCRTSRYGMPFCWSYSFRWLQSLKVGEISDGVVIDFKETGVVGMLYSYELLR